MSALRDSARMTSRFLIPHSPPTSIKLNTRRSFCFCSSRAASAAAAARATARAANWSRSDPRRSRVAAPPSVEIYRSEIPADVRDLASGNVDASLLPDLAPVLARLDLPGPIRSLNVSNATAVALYVAARRSTGDTQTS